MTVQDGSHIEQSTGFDSESGVIVIEKGYVKNDRGFLNGNEQARGIR